MSWPWRGYGFGPSPSDTQLLDQVALGGRVPILLHIPLYGRPKNQKQIRNPIPVAFGGQVCQGFPLFFVSCGT